MPTPNTPATRRSGFVEYIAAHEVEIIEQGARFIDKPALKRMLKKNAEYIVSADLRKAWETEEGVASIQRALEESIFYGATLPETGSIIPYGGVVDFVPGLQAFTAGLTSGKNAPCKTIRIDCICENDKYDIGVKDGNFYCDIKIGIPRGECIGVVVAAEKTDGVIIGDVYDTNRLMEKAERHSTAYKYYLRDMQMMRKAQSEGKNYIEKSGNKFYEKDIVSPYVGADRHEMLKKLAGKSFLYPLFKENMVSQVFAERSTEQNDRQPQTPARREPLDVIDRTARAMITDAEIIDEPENVSEPAGKPEEPAKPAPAEKKQEKKNDVKKKDDLFG